MRPMSLDMQSCICKSKTTNKTKNIFFSKNLASLKNKEKNLFHKKKRNYRNNIL